jgi:Na+-driven multidrug efflux pump
MSAIGVAVEAAISVLVAAFLLFRTDEALRFRERWWPISIDPSWSEFRRINARIVGGGLIFLGSVVLIALLAKVLGPIR